MDILYDAKTKKIINVFMYSGEFDRSGVVNDIELMQFLTKNNLNINNVAIWTFINLSQRKLLPKNFYTEYHNYFVVQDEITKKCIGVQIGNEKQIIVKKQTSNDDMPLIWSGTFNDSVSYSIINKKFSLGLAERGFNIKVASYRKALRSELGNKEHEQLKKLGISNGYHKDLQDAIRLYCFLPIGRTIPAPYSISFTMMETNTIHPSLTHKLNSYYQECWFPCFLENTYIDFKNGMQRKISGIKKLESIRSHSGKIYRVRETSCRKYTGTILKINTALKDDHHSCTPEHPFYAAKKQSDEKVFIQAKDLNRYCFLIYPREINDNPNATIDLAYEFKMKNESGLIPKIHCKTLELRTREKVYNHINDKDVMYDFALNGNRRIKNELVITNDLAEIFGIFTGMEVKTINPLQKDKREYELSCKNNDAMFTFARKIREIFSLPMSVSKNDLKITTNNDVLIRVLELQSQLYKYFNQSNKRSFLKGLFAAKAGFHYNNYMCEIKKFNRACTAIKFILDCGVCPSISSLDPMITTKISLSEEQRKLFATNITMGENIEYESKDFIIKKDAVLMRILSIDKVEVNDTNVYNLEVPGDNSYIANFNAVHNCNFNIDQFKQAGVDRVITKMPLGFDEKRFVPGLEKAQNINYKLLNPNPEKYPAKPEGFVFLSIFRCSYRKGPDVLIKAFRKAFSKSDNVSLVIFSRHYWGNIQNDKLNTVDACESYLKEWVQNDENAPPIYLSTDYISDEQMPNVYAIGDAFVLPSRGEGLCMPCLEAGGCEVPIIAPEHSGFGEYMNNDRGYVIHTDGYENIGHIDFSSGKPIYKGDNPEWGVWVTKQFENQEFPIFGEVVVNETAEIMNDVFENYSKAKSKAKLMRNYVLDNFTWDKCFDNVVQRINEIKKAIK
jgi:glycosyltransferase involved in cell wall biosynthesis